MEDEEIMCIALLKAKSLNALNQIDLKTLSNLFNLGSKSSFEDSLLEVKKTIGYIILIQRQDIHQYLNLSKFRRLPVSLYNQLFNYCTELWDLFCSEKLSIDKSNLKNFQQIKTPMQRLSKSLNEVKQINQDKGNGSQMNFNRFNHFYPQFGGGNGERPIDFENEQQMPPYMFPYQNFMGSNVNNVGGSLFQNYNSNSKGPLFGSNMLYQNRGSTEPFNPEILSNKPIFAPKNKNSQEFKFVPEVQNKKQSIEEQSQNSLIGFKQEEMSEKDPKEDNQGEKEKESREMESEEGAIGTLKGCFCGQGSDSTLFKCQLCPKQFHFKCWQSQIKIDAICPFCRVEKKHLYTKLVGGPIFQRCSLTDHQFFRTRKIILNDEEIRALSEAIQHIDNNPEKTWAELRVLKISKQPQEQRKKGRNSFVMPLYELRRMLEKKLLQLKFKNIVQGDCIIFVLVCVTPKDLPEVQKDIQSLNKGNENIKFLKDWMTLKGLQTYEISAMHPVTKNRIIWPVRGSRCQHLECQDLPVIYDQGIKKEGKIICSYCHKEYSVYEPFYCDPTLLKIMKRNISQSELKIDLTQLDDRMGVESSEQRSQR